LSASGNECEWREVRVHNSFVGKKRRGRNGAGGTVDVGSAGESRDTSARGFRVCGAIRIFIDDGELASETA